MKTTAEIADPLFSRAKQHCSTKGISTGEPIDASIRFAVKPFGFRGKGQAIEAWSEIRELAYEGRGGSN